jgi:hypothetical protein
VSARRRSPRPRLELDEAERLIRKALEDDPHATDVNRFVLDHGTAYRPEERPFDIPAGARHDAFRNAFRLARERDLTYCEGFTLPRGWDDQPNRHAWCLDEAGRVVDPSPGWADPGATLRDCYFGVAIPLDVAAPFAGGDEPRANGALYEMTGRMAELAARL